jgi:PTS system fructose-specific IIC component
MAKIVAVTACPTGIAHTFMAAEKLEQTAKALGHEIKVETNGSAGVENGLTKADIEAADLVIVAADTKVEMNRFNGKVLVNTGVQDGIHKAEKLINDGLASKEVYVAKQENNSSSNAKGAYKHLMSGVSNMLPFVVAGGILIALAFLFDFNNIGASDYGWGNTFSAFIGDAGKAAFGFMLPILGGYIAYSIADRPGLAVGFVGGSLASSGGSGFLGAIAAGFLAGFLVNLLKKAFSGLPKSLEGIKPILLFPLFGVFLIAVSMLGVNYFMTPINEGLNSFLEGLSGGNAVIMGLIVGGMMAVDMGGPINKAAYVFGVGTLANGSSEVMAAVMVGGMVPPLGIALATTFFKNKFTKEQHEAGKTNYVMGLSFITEGAIPFAAANPKAVLPSIIAGSALAGALSAVFGAASPAPHGGLFVIPLIDGALMYVVALLAGSALTAFLLNVLLPDVE